MFYSGMMGVKPKRWNHVGIYLRLEIVRLVVLFVVVVVADFDTDYIRYIAFDSDSFVDMIMTH